MEMQQVNYGRRRKQWIMLTKPGWNLPTLGALFFLAVHLLVVGLVWNAGEEAAYAFYHQNGFSWSGVKSGNVHAVFTHIFLHGNGLHVVVNALLFYDAASRLGHVLRPKKVILLFMASALTASIIHILAQVIFQGLPSEPLVGASGGVMGLYLAVTVLYPHSKMAIIKVSARNVGKGFLIASALLFIMTPGLKVPLFSQLGEWSKVLFGPALFKMAHLYHFFGGLTGMILVERMLPALVTLEELKAAREAREGKLLASQAQEPS